MYKHRLIFVSLMLILVLLLSSCSSATPEATATPTRTPLPPATDTPVPTPTATATPIPPTPTPEAFGLTPPPPDVNPLTGLKMEAPSVLDRIPLAIKISNSPEVRPQSGMNSADLVFEHFAEGGITRYTAVFYGTDAEQVGSVRSGRLIDLEIPAMYQALFAYSGSSAGVKDHIRSSDLFPDYIAAPDFGTGEPYFYRVPRDGQAFEHTLFTDPGVLRKLADEREINARPDYKRWMAFSPTPQQVGEPISYFEVNYLSGVCTAEWAYDEATGNWLRSIAGTVHTDYLTGEQIRASNVVLIFTYHIETDILEDIWGGGHMSIQMQLWDSGPALVFRDGQMIQGYWTRAARDHMLTFTDGKGEVLPLKPGNTWFQVVPLDTTSEEIEAGQLRFTP
ncbi:MAG: DUF3048 domain-containing protein [Anaerolineae bacterium]|nr:DUF3048 domain-containing protein [Anaerolineae bacterium]